MKINFKHINKVHARLKDGSKKVYYYHRLSGKRIEGEPGTLQFQVSYETASEAAKAKTTEFQSIIVDYFDSTDFSGLAERTKSDYRKHRRHIEDKWATLPIVCLDDKHIKQHAKKWHNALVKTIGARQGDLVLATMRRIVSYAVSLSILDRNHLLDLTSAYTADRSDAIWTRDDVAAFMAIANKGMRLALIVALHLGRRQGDLIKLTWGDYDGTFIMVANNKGRRKIRFPARCTDTLKASLDAAKLGIGRIPHKNERILQTLEGKPWIESHFSTKFSAAKNCAGLHHLHFHDLRGTAVTVLAETGSTNAQIASITGHSMRHVEKIIDKYMARTRFLNDEATARLNASWIASVGQAD
jgi:integrase